MSIQKAPLEQRLNALARSIFRQPYGFLVIALCIAVFYLFKENQTLRQDNQQLQSDYINTLKEINNGLQQLSDTTHKLIK